MGFFSDLFGRSGRVVRGQASDAVSAFEDANFDTTVRQTIADMKEELNNVVRSSAVAMSNYNRLDAEYQKYERQSADWKARANQALDAGNEDLAKKALGKKAESDQQVSAMQSAIEQARQASDNLKSQVTELKRKIDEGERTATTLVARKNAATAQKKSGRSHGGCGEGRQCVRAAIPFRGACRKGRSDGQSIPGVRISYQGSESRSRVCATGRSFGRRATGSAEARARAAETKHSVEPAFGSRPLTHDLRQ